MSASAHTYQTTLARAPFSGDGHTILANAMLRDRRMSWKARGLLAYLGSHTIGWGISEKQLANEAPDGLASVRTGLAELEEHGYMIRFRERLSDGHLGDAMWAVSDNPDNLEDYAAQLVADLQEREGRRFVRMPTRTRKRGAKASAAPTSENRTLDDDERNPRSEPGCGYPKLDEPNQADRITKNTNAVREGEEMDARTRANGAPTPGEDPSGGGGLRGGRRDPGVSMSARDLIASVVDRGLSEHEGVSDDEWTELAALADAVRPVVEAHGSLSWEEYTAWLHQGWAHADGRPTYRTFVGALRWRLNPERVRREAWQWAAEQRAAQGHSGPQGGREAAAPEPDVATCGVHGTQLTAEHRCLVCDRETAQEEAAWRERQGTPGDAPADGGQEQESGETDPDVLAAMQASLNGQTTDHNSTKSGISAAAQASADAVRAQMAADRATVAG